MCVADKAVSDSNVDLWEDNRAEDDLSPEEIQMVHTNTQTRTQTLTHTHSHTLTHTQSDHCINVTQHHDELCVCVCVCQFEQENQRLVGEMNSLLDEVR